jgi:CxxC motif-containing protein
MIGNQCKEGKDYVIAEFRAPVRVFTATILTEDGKYLLPVKTDKPVFKDDLKKIMKAIANLRVKPPIKMGQEIVHNILETGANLIATSSR